MTDRGVGVRFDLADPDAPPGAEALRLALRAGGMGTWSWTRATDVTVWDDLTCELFGVVAAPVDFAAWIELIHPDDRELARSTAVGALGVGAGYHLVHRVVLPTGEVRHIEGRADAVHDAAGAIAGLRGVVLDVTDRERSRQRAERLASQWKLLADAGVALASTLDPDGIVGRLGELVVPALADACEVALVGSDGRVARFVRAPGADDERLRRREQASVFDVADHPIAAVLRTGKTVRLAVGPETPPSAFGPPDDDTTSSSFGVTEAAIVPLVVRGEVIGALALGVAASGRTLDDDTVDLATELGARAALCLDNARLFADQRTIADTLQRSLVPPDLPRPGWVDLAGRYWVPGGGIDVGGDFYDVVDTNGDLTLVIGDVCGKGIEAASLTALARHTVRAGLVHVGDSGVALRWLHDSFRAEARHSFVSVAVVRLVRSEHGVVAYSRVGGHPRPIVIRADGSTDLIEAAGTAPGLPVWRAAPEVCFELAPGDTLVLHTDGVTDVPGDGGLSTEQLLALLVDAARGAPGADELATAIGVRLERIRPRRLRTDDIALLIATVPGA